MRIDVNEQYMVTLREVYNPVIIRDESAGGVAVCERDGKIEVTWLKAGEDTKEQIANSPASPVQQLKAEIAALIPKLEAIDSITGWQETGPIIRRLRQLSAV